MGGEGVPHPVGRQVAPDRADARVEPLPEDPRHAPGRDSPSRFLSDVAPQVEEDRLVQPAPELPPVCGRPDGQVFPKRANRLPADGDDANLSPLPRDADGGRFDGEVPHSQGAEFPDTKPGGVQQFKDRGVPLLPEGPARKPPKESVHLVDGEKLRQAHRPPRRGDPHGGIRVDLSVRDEEPEEGPDRGNLAGGRRRTDLLPGVPARRIELQGEEPAEIRSGHLRPVDGFRVPPFPSSLRNRWSRSTSLRYARTVSAEAFRSASRNPVNRSTTGIPNDSFPPHRKRVL